ncbi:MAG: restriction endonuclease [bacterium]
MKQNLSVQDLINEAIKFSKILSINQDPLLFGITDGKAVGTYAEKKFKEFVSESYICNSGSVARGIDFPDLLIDIKCTSIKQPQSSCPFKSAGQKIFGLGYSLLVFVYEKFDNHELKTGQLKILHTIFIEKERTGDFQITSGISDLLKNNANTDDLVAFLFDKNLPIDDILAKDLAEEILKNPPQIGYLTISNALQWRLQYSRVIEQAGKVDGVVRVN